FLSLLCQTLSCRLTLPYYLLFGPMLLSQTISIQIRASRFPITISSGQCQFIRCNIYSYEIVAENTALGKHITKRIDDHRATILELIIIHTDGVGKYRIDRVVIRPGRQPLHEPVPTLHPVELQPQRRGIRLATLPSLRIDEPGT